MTAARGMRRPARRRAQERVPMEKTKGSQRMLGVRGRMGAFPVVVWFVGRLSAVGGVGLKGIGVRDPWLVVRGWWGGHESRATDHEAVIIVEAGRGVCGNGSNMLLIVLIHVFPFDAKMWRHHVDFLRGAGRRVITPNLPGFGGTEGRARDKTSMEAFAEVVHGVIEREAGGRRLSGVFDGGLCVAGVAAGSSGVGGGGDVD